MEIDALCALHFGTRSAAESGARLVLCAPRETGFPQGGKSTHPYQGLGGAWCGRVRLCPLSRLPMVPRPQLFFSKPGGGIRSHSPAFFIKRFRARPSLGPVGEARVHSSLQATSAHHPGTGPHPVALLTLCRELKPSSSRWGDPCAAAMPPTPP